MHNTAVLVSSEERKVIAIDNSIFHLPRAFGLFTISFRYIINILLLLRYSSNDNVSLLSLGLSHSINLSSNALVIFIGL